MQKGEKYTVLSRMTNIPVGTLFKKAKDQREGKSLARRPSWYRAGAAPGT
ncbi:hypothetical protein PI125_g10145 [Phytophthora idaei]|nr:hypothetical protein PI125_g10145 [Phytophthora idaei]